MGITGKGQKLIPSDVKGYGDIDMEHITTIYLQNFITHMESQCLGRGTVRLYSQKLACVLHHAYKNELFDVRILDRAQRPQKLKDKKSGCVSHN